MIQIIVLESQIVVIMLVSTIEIILDMVKIEKLGV